MEREKWGVADVTSSRVQPRAASLKLCPWGVDQVVSFPYSKSQDLPTAGTSSLFIFPVAPAGLEFGILLLHAREPVCFRQG